MLLHILSPVYSSTIYFKYTEHITPVLLFVDFKHVLIYFKAMFHFYTHL